MSVKLDSGAPDGFVTRSSLATIRLFAGIMFASKSGWSRSSRTA